MSAFYSCKKKGVARTPFGARHAGKKRTLLRGRRKEKRKKRRVPPANHGAPFCVKKRGGLPTIFFDLLYSRGTGGGREKRRENHTTADLVGEKRGEWVKFSPVYMIKEGKLKKA